MCCVCRLVKMRLWFSAALRRGLAHIHSASWEVAMISITLISMVKRNKVRLDLWIEYGSTAITPSIRMIDKCTQPGPFLAYNSVTILWYARYLDKYLSHISQSCLPTKPKSLPFNADISGVSCNLPSLWLLMQSSTTARACCTKSSSFICRWCIKILRKRENLTRSRWLTEV